MSSKYESTNKKAVDTSPYTLRVIRRGVVHISITDALTTGFEGEETVELGEIDANTFYPMVFVSWDGTDEVPDPDLIQYFPNQRLEWDAEGLIEKAMNYSIQSTGTSPNKLQLKIRAYNRDGAIADDRFYWTLCSLWAGPRTLGDEAEWNYG